MIQWIALAVAIDADSTAHNAQNLSAQAEHQSKSNSSLVIIRPVDLIDDESHQLPEGSNFWKHLCFSRRKILSTVPWATISIKKGDILNLEEYKDGAGQPLVRIQISVYAKVKRQYEDGYVVSLYVPGTIEQVAGAIEGKI